MHREVANPHRPLAGTTWIVDTIATTATVSSMHASTEGKVLLRIDGDTFRASSGCRDAEGNVMVAGDDLRFSATVQTSGFHRKRKSSTGTSTTFLSSTRLTKSICMRLCAGPRNCKMIFLDQVGEAVRISCELARG